MPSRTSLGRVAPGVGLLLRELRRRRGMTQDEVAAASGVTQGALSNYEAAYKDLRLDTFLRVLEWLELSPAEFFETLEQRRPKRNRAPRRRPGARRH